VLRWLRRQLRQPTPDREQIEAAIAYEDPAELRRLVARQPFTELQHRYLEDLLQRWEAALRDAGREEA
jgi:hypothetical protein